MPAYSDTHRKRAFLKRIEIVHAILFFFLLIILARIIELQLLKGKEYEEVAQSQHFGGIILPAKRGEILSRNSKTAETNILATNTTLDLLYVDPFVTKDKSRVARILAETVLTEEFDTLCRSGNPECPREFRSYYTSAFEPVRKVVRPSDPNLEEDVNSIEPEIPEEPEEIPPRESIERQFARNIEQRISQEFISFVPLLYGATKVQVRQIQEYAIPGIFASAEEKLVYANPQLVPSFERRRIGRLLSPVLGLDDELVADRIQKRRLRYVPILRRMPPDMSKKIKQMKADAADDAAAERTSLREEGYFDAAEKVESLLRGIALIPEHWRIYPDATIASQVVGFLSINQEPQNGMERVFDHELRGQEGRIQTLTDPFGGQIVSEEQTVVQARDGRSMVLTIDRELQKQVEDVLDRAVKEFVADSGQVIIMEPYTGEIIVLANAPTFDRNNYSTVYERDFVTVHQFDRPKVVAEIHDPRTNGLVVRAYINDLLPEGRQRLSRELQLKLLELEELYDLEDLKRYYIYLGENNRLELFPGEGDEWLQYSNRIGVGAYVNRTAQEIYEPGSVFKPITMAVALDQGEITPDDTYFDEGTVEIDEFTIANAEGRVFDEVTMTECLSFSVNTCMTSVSEKLGKKLFYSYIQRFGFGEITGVELEGEKPGQVLDWRKWSNALLATASYGQGISATPLQVASAYAVLANGGKRVKPTIIDRWINPDGTEEDIQPQIVEQVITEESAATVTAMLTRATEEGFARRAQVPGYRLAGKTGTSQIAGPGGKYEKTGSGTSITSFAGYAPVDHPKFVMLVKFDRPRTVEYGSQSAAPVFREVAEILFEYYGIPPDDL